MECENGGKLFWECDITAISSGMSGMWCWNGIFGMYGNGMFVILVNIYFVEFISVSHNVMATDIVVSRDNPQPLISFTSIRSSPSSIYRNYDFHLN